MEQNPISLGRFLLACEKGCVPFGLHFLQVQMDQLDNVGQDKKPSSTMGNLMSEEGFLYRTNREFHNEYSRVLDLLCLLLKFPMCWPLITRFR